jgi:hypothetical protein
VGIFNSTICSTQDDGLGLAGFGKGRLIEGALYFLVFPCLLANWAHLIVSIGL